jgi:hypothetical protein
MTVTSMFDIQVGPEPSPAEFTAYETWRAGDGAPSALLALLTEPPTASVYLPAPAPVSASPTTMEGTS